MSHRVRARVDPRQFRLPAADERSAVRRCRDASGEGGLWSPTSAGRRARHIERLEQAVRSPQGNRDAIASHLSAPTANLGEDVLGRGRKAAL